MSPTNDPLSAALWGLVQQLQVRAASDPQMRAALSGLATRGLQVLGDPPDLGVILGRLNELIGGGGSGRANFATDSDVEPEVLDAEIVEETAADRSGNPTLDALSQARAVFLQRRLAAVRAAAAAVAANRDDPQAEARLLAELAVTDELLAWWTTTS